MNRRIIDKPSIKKSEGVESPTNQTSTFDVEHKVDEQIVTFHLINGKRVSMRSPNTKQFLLLQSWLQSVEQEFKSDQLVAIKLASLCIIEFDGKPKITFDELLDSLEFDDLERVAAAISLFRDKIDALSARASTNGSKPNFIKS
ncbi:hypothetical protein H6G93_09245 [Nostoc sp. FACHB-973]|nr:hypothetical protein [Nostoc sp. FACHB-973]